MIRFICPTCNKRFKAPDDGAGKKFACPRCRQRLEVPAPSVPRPVNRTVLGELEPAGSVTLRCENCGKPFLVPPDQIGTGRPIRCPSCDGAVKEYANVPPPVRRQTPADTVDAEQDGDEDGWPDTYGGDVDPKHGSHAPPFRPDPLGLAMTALGGFCFCVGLGVAFYYWMIFDPTVPRYPGAGPESEARERIYNIGRMQDRMMGTVIGIVATALGLVVGLVGLAWVRGRPR